MAGIIIFCGSYLIAASVAVAVAWFTLASDKKHPALFVSLSLVSAYIGGKVASLLWYNPRPFVDGHFTPLITHAADNGFPSEHMLLASALAATVTYFNWKWGAVLWVMAIVIGLARVAAGTHHLIDIAGSAVIAIGAVGITHVVLTRVRASSAA